MTAIDGTSLNVVHICDESEVVNKAQVMTHPNHNHWWLYAHETYYTYITYCPYCGGRLPKVTLTTKQEAQS